jgi:hypothetical protein
MKTTNKLTRLLQYCFAIVFLMFFGEINIADARGGYSGGSSYSSGFNSPHGSSSGGSSFVALTQRSWPSLVQAIAVLLLVLLPIAFYREISNLVRFWNQKFTTDPDLIEFTKSVHPGFTNGYSVKYFRNSEIWKVQPRPSALPPEEYQALIDTPTLLQGVDDLFMRYQQDWTQKNFEIMTEYLNTPFYEQQSDRFQKAFREGYDVVYRPRVNIVIPLTYEFRDEAGFFRVQIEAAMVNFSLSPQGRVLGGEPTVRQFTEYWDIRVDAPTEPTEEPQFHLLDISISNLPDDLPDYTSIPREIGLSDWLADKITKFIPLSWYQ